MVTEIKRFRDDGSGFDTWALEPVLVKCPRCGNRAEARVSAQDGFVLTRRLTCTSCGLILDRLSDGYGGPTWSGFELWLSAPFRGEVFWAHNGTHLALLKAFIGATLRERFPDGHLEGSHWESQTMVEMLPKWMKAAANREPLLALIDDLELTRTIPLPTMLASLLREHRVRAVPNEHDLLFTTSHGAPWRRTNFRAQVWLPAVEAAGLPSGMRFHDLRHCYATWLVSDSVPINEVQRLLGHEQASTTLDRYTHPTRGHDAHVRGVFAAPADFLLTFGPDPHPRLPESRPRHSRRTTPSVQVRPPAAWETRPSPPS